MCFVITRGLSEIYDILTHITFLNIEALKIHQQIRDKEGRPSRLWQVLETQMQRQADLSGQDLDQAI